MKKSFAVLLGATALLSACGSPAEEAADAEAEAEAMRGYADDMEDAGMIADEEADAMEAEAEDAAEAFDVEASPDDGISDPPDPDVSEL